MIARRRSGWLVSTLLLGVCLTLAAFVYGQLQMEMPGPAPAVSAETPPLPVLPAQPNYTMAPVEDFSAILERPLFSPTRRPPAEGEVPNKASEPEPDNEPRLCANSGYSPQKKPSRLNARPI